MRLVLDTNTALSGLLWRGSPAHLIDAALAGRAVLVSSTPLLAELEGVLRRAKFERVLQLRGIQADDLVDGYAALVSIVAPAEIQPTVLADPADDQVLAAAVAGQADLIVSGDAHLLDLKRFLGIELVSPAVAVQRVDAIPTAEE